MENKNLRHNPIREKLKQYNLKSVYITAIELLNIEFSLRPIAVASAPWLVLLLVKWAFQETSLDNDTGKDMTLKDLAQLRQEIWDLPQAEPASNEFNRHRLIRSIGFVQFELQKPASIDFARWPSIINLLAPTHPARAMFEHKVKLNTSDFLDLAYALRCLIVTKNLYFTKNNLAMLYDGYGPKVDTFLKLLSRTPEALQKELPSYINNSQQADLEEYEFPVFKKFPLLEIVPDEYFCWHPLVFARALDDLVHTQLLGEGQKYADSYSKVFEQYVVNLALATKLPHTSEKEFKQIVGKDKHAVEVILCDATSQTNVYIEAKFGLYPDEAITRDSSRVLVLKLKKLLEAVSKGVSVSNLIDNEDPLKKLKTANTDYLLVVTNRPLYVDSAATVETLCASADVEGTVWENIKYSERLPKENVFFLSIEEYESLMVIVSRQEIDLNELLENLSKKVRGGAWFINFSKLAEPQLNQRHFSPQVISAKRSAQNRIENLASKYI